MNSSESVLTHQTTILFDPEQPIFKEHFPSAPIVPAYLQLARARDEAARWLGCPVSLVTVKGMKYKGLITPGREVLMRFEKRASEDVISVSFILDGEVATTGQLVLR